MIILLDKDKQHISHVESKKNDTDEFIQQKDQQT